MPNPAPSVVLHHGMRCTKIPRAAPAPAFPSPPISQDSSEMQFSLFHTSPTPSVKNNILPTHIDNPVTGVSPALTTSATAGSDTSTTFNADEEYVTHATGRAQSQTSQSSPSDILGGLSNGSLSPTGSHTQTTRGILRISPSSATGTAGAGNNPAQDSANKPSHAEHGSTLTKTIVGSVLGSLAFLAIILLICFFAVRRRRRRSRKKHARISNDQLLQSGRGSPEDWNRRYQSPVPPPRPDTPQFGFGIPQRIPRDRFSSTNNSSVANMSFVNLSPANPPLARFPEPTENPFASPEDPPEAHDPFIVRRRYSSTSALRPESQTEAEKALFRTRLYLTTANPSQQSLGSTIILPGRSSRESENRGDKHESEKEEEEEEEEARQKAKEDEIEEEPYLSTPSMSVRDTIRTSARSDPFDLEIPRNSTIDRVLKMTAHWKRQY